MVVVSTTEQSTNNAMSDAMVSFMDESMVVSTMEQTTNDAVGRSMASFMGRSMAFFMNKEPTWHTASPMTEARVSTTEEQSKGIL